MFETLQQFAADDSGQGTVEYLLMLSGVALAVVVIVLVIKSKLNSTADKATSGW